MSAHAQIMTVMRSQLDLYEDAVLIRPSALAAATHHAIAPRPEDAGKYENLVAYLPLQMLTTMARKMLGKRFSHESDHTDAHQGDLFSGTLQPRYPVPREPGAEAAYKRRQDLTPEERAWNVDQLRKSAKARLEHADALEAEGALGGVA